MDGTTAGTASTAATESNMPLRARFRFFMYFPPVKLSIHSLSPPFPLYRTVARNTDLIATAPDVCWEVGFGEDMIWIHHGCHRITATHDHTSQCWRHNGIRPDSIINT